MLHVELKSLRSEFSRRLVRERHARFVQQERDHREKLKEEADLADQDFLSIAQAAIEATAEDIAAFDDTLMVYETLTVEEVMRLRKRIDALLEERELLLENAFTLPDGRHAFKAKNGRVFDAEGIELGRDVIDPDDIPDSKTSWEAFSDNTQRLDDANSQLQENLDFLEEIDDIRDERNKGDLTEEKLQELEERLEKVVPDSIRARKTALDASEPVAPASDHFSAAATARTIDLDTLKIDAPSLDG